RQLCRALSPSTAFFRSVAEIERIRPAARGKLEVVGLKSWGADPYARGAWAYFRPGQVRELAAGLGAPHGRVQICGEHLAAARRGDRKSTRLNSSHVKTS